MTPATLLRQLEADGVRLTLTPAGTLKAAGEQSAISRWLPVLRERKTEILTALADLAPDIQDFIDDIEERAAIMEHDAADCYPDRQAATAAAYEDCKIIWLERIRR